jgi:TonB-dependent receptor
VRFAHRQASGTLALLPNQASGTLALRPNQASGTLALLFKQAGVPLALLRAALRAAAARAPLKFPPLKFGIFLGFGILGFGICACSCAAAAAAGASTAAGAGTGVITGRVFNAATGEYIRNAEIRLEGTATLVYSEDGGFYRLQDVPAGPATLTAGYASVRSATAATVVPAGGEVTLDFELQPILYGPAARPAAAAAQDDKNVVLLDKFVVSESREGQAKAIMEQRAAINAKTVIATDNFGELTMGDVGEFMKYMPGITMHYEVDAHTVSIGGLDSKYTRFSQNGATMASASGGRGASMSEISITGIESIEFNQTLTAGMDAGGGAGVINLKSKNAFDRKNPLLQFTAGMNGLDTAANLRRTYWPDDRKHFNTRPNAQLGYARSFFNRRLGIELNLSYDGKANRQDISRVEYTYPAPASIAAGGAPDPVITGIDMQPGLAYTNRAAANISLDYKISRNLVFSLRGNYQNFVSEYYNQYTWLRVQQQLAFAAAAAGESTHTRVVARPTTLPTPTEANPAAVTTYYPYLQTEFSHNYVERDNWLLTPRLVYKNGPLEISLAGSYSDARTRARNGPEKGFFLNTYSRLSRIGASAVRADTTTPAWTFTQLRDESGTPIGGDWSVPENWGARDTVSGNTRIQPTVAETSRWSGQLDASYKKMLIGLPFMFKAGAAARSNEFSSDGGNIRYTYVGDTGRQTSTTIPYTKNYRFDLGLDGKEGNVNSLGWRIDNSYALWDIYEAHPGWFTPDTVGNFTRALVAPRHLVEDVAAAYFEINTKVQRLRLNAGLRYERTETEVDTLYIRSNADVAADGYDVSTVEGVYYKYYNGRRFKRVTAYDNFFLSGGAKYDITANLQAQLSASQSIQRPDYGNLAGVMSYNETDWQRWVPNPNLKPERLTKYFVSLQQRIRPAGLLGVSAYRMDIDGKQIANMQISRAEAEAQTGISLADDGEEVIYRSTKNTAGRRSIHGLTIDYNQQLTFLPGALKGLSAFGSFTRTWWPAVEDDAELNNVVPHSANGGFRYRYGRLNLQIRATWQDDKQRSVTKPAGDTSTYLHDHIYQKARLMVDFSGDFKLSKNYTFVFSLRNITNSPYIEYSNTRDRMYCYFIHGILWNCAIKGTF